MALTPDERKIAESRIAEIGAQIEAINAALDESMAPIDDETLRLRAELAQERIALVQSITRGMRD